jgi:uracil-DNA glycosylase
MLYFLVTIIKNIHWVRFMSQSLSSHNDPAALLAWYVAMGVSEAQGDEPVDRFTPENSGITAPAPQTAIETKQTSPTVQKVTPKPVSAQAASSADFRDLLKKAENIAAQCRNLAELKSALETFDGCALKRTATNTVFSSGIVEAELMVISAAPGADEDRTGLAFQGISGQLLDKMIAAIGYTRETNTYLAHIVPWRPLGNRNPDSQSLALCRPFMMKHIELAKPKVLLLLGNAAACTISSSDELIARMRGKWQMVTIDGHEIAAMPTYHPDYLLKHPRYKRDSWQDLLALKQTLKAKL